MTVLCYVMLHDLRDFADVIQVTNQLALSKSKGRLSGWACITWALYIQVQRSKTEEVRNWKCIRGDGGDHIAKNWVASRTYEQRPSSQPERERKPQFYSCKMLNSPPSHLNLKMIWGPEKDTAQLKLWCKPSEILESKSNSVPGLLTSRNHEIINRCWFKPQTHGSNPLHSNRKWLFDFYSGLAFLSLCILEYSCFFWNWC